MSEELTQTGVRFSKQLWQEFRQDVKARKGGVDGHLRNELETALREYMHATKGGDTHDRLRRMENQLDEVATAVLEDGEKKKESHVSTETENKLRDIRKQIEDETDGSPKVHTEVVELAIREHAGSSAPTIRRYKDLLKQDKELFEHPENKRLFFRDSKDYVLAVNALRKGGKISAEEYSGIVNNHGEDWWLDQQEQEKQDQPKGFQ